jgi:hypothetical protein
MPKARIFISLVVILASTLSLLVVALQMKPVEAAASRYEYHDSGDDVNRVVWGAIWRAQTFVADSNHSVTSVRLKLSRLGSPGTLTVSIQPVENDDFPSGVDLTSGSTSGDNLTTNEWRRIDFTNPYTLVGGTKYAIVLRAPYGNSSNLVRWRANTAGGYDDGTMLQSTDSGGTWTKGGADCMFEVWGESTSEVVAEAWVDDNWAGSSPGDNVDGHTFGYDAFATIQDGVNAVTGSTVHVAAGEYEPVTKIRLNKNGLILLGPQADVDPRPSMGTVRTPGSAGEAIVGGMDFNLLNIIEIDADNVTINGFEIKSGSADLIYQTNAHSGTVVKYCIVHDGNGDDGIQLKQCTNGTLEYNYVYDIASPGDALSIADNSTDCKILCNEARDIATANAAIHSYGSDNLEIVGNLVDDVTQGNNKGGIGIRIGNKNGNDSNRSGGLIKDNVISNVAKTGIEIMTSHVVIDGNDISQCESDDGGIFLGYSITDITIRGNNIHDNTLSTFIRPNSAGIFVENRVDADNVTIKYNNIYSNVPYGLVNEAPVLLDVTNNWWGDPSGPSHSPGNGDNVSDNVTYTPWLGAPLVLPAVHYKHLGPGSHVVDASVEADTKVTLTVIPEHSETGIYIAKYESQPFPGEPFPDTSLGKFIDIYLSNPDAVVWPILIELSYTEAEVAVAGVDESSLGLYYYEGPDTFHRCSDTGVNTVDNYIFANVTSQEAGYLAASPFGSGSRPTPVPPAPVGGNVYPVNKAALLVPWIALAAAIVVGGLFLMRRRAQS